MDQFPIEVLIEIAKKDHNIWRLMTLNMPLFAKFTQSAYGQRVLINQFVTIKNEGSCTRLGISSGVDLIELFIWLDGTQYWYKNGVYHRDGDRPAIVLTDAQYWLTNGKQHRDNDKPAYVHNNGDQSWYQNGQRHRDGDLPAVINANGTQEYWVNDVKK